MDIAGKKVVITGGGRGMGRQFAADLHQREAQPFVLDVVQENLDSLQDEHGIPGAIVDVNGASYFR